jgi:hypothetical protein
VKVAAVAFMLCASSGEVVGPCWWEAMPARTAADCALERMRLLGRIGGDGGLIIFASRCEDGRGEIVEWNWRDLPPPRSRGR